jgi:D-serine deaminase-like pyridoxal phosphate-dependent protein
MLSKALSANCVLRPHIKTHKTVEGALLQTGNDKSTGICVSTVAEAEFFAAAGFTDILYTNPITPDKLLRLEKIMAKNGQTTHVMVDSLEGLRCLENEHKSQTSAGVVPTVWSVFLKIDAGYHRAGVDVTRGSAQAVRVAKQITASQCVNLRGIYSHSGNGYAAVNAAGCQRVLAEEAEMMSACANDLRAAKAVSHKEGADMVVAIGSTPSCSQPFAIADARGGQGGAGAQPSGVTEVHPGNYIFFDRQQQLVGACGPEDIACALLVRVCGHYPGRKPQQLLIDAGSIAFSKDVIDHKAGSTLDPTKPTPGYGGVKGWPGLSIVSLSQESAKLVSC